MNIQDDITRLDREGLLDTLLADRTTGGQILWASNDYEDRGEAFAWGSGITPALLTGENAGSVTTRARRDFERPSASGTRHAEPFTPSAVCRAVIDRLDVHWFRRQEGYWKIDIDNGRVFFPKRRTWRQYADSRRIEFACGEAPFLVNRCDAVTGEAVPIDERVGILDRKLRGVSENAVHEREWREWALRAVQSVYGYEYRGDRLVLARVHLAASYAEYYRERWGRAPSVEDERRIAEVLSWNLWQMDGRTDRIPGLLEPEEFHQISLREYLGEETHRQDRQPPCRVMNWKNRRTTEFRAVRTGKGAESLRFSYGVGTPPVPERAVPESGDQGARFPELMENAFAAADYVELVHPARLLPHSELERANRTELPPGRSGVVCWEPDAGAWFPGAEIPGGAAVSRIVRRHR